jgi:CRP-like cAMP-binding protein
MVTMDLFRAEDNPREFAAGNTIFSEGDAGDHMYVVIAGEVDLLVKGKLVEHLTPGGVLGEMALIDTGTRSATAIARSDCKLATIDEKALQVSGSTDAEFCAAIDADHCRAIAPDGRAALTDFHPQGRHR